MVARVIDQFLKLVAIDSPSGHEESLRSFILERLKQPHLACIQDSFGNFFVPVNCTEAPPITLPAISIRLGMQWGKACL